MLTSAIYRGLRSVFFKTFLFSLYQKYIREFVFRKLLRYLFFSKIIQFFLGKDCEVHPPSQDMIIFYPLSPQYRVKEATNQSYLKKDSPKISKHIKKDLYMNPRHWTSKVTKYNSSSKVFQESCLQHKNIQWNGHLRVLKYLSVIKRCPQLGGSATKIVTFGTIWDICYWEVSLYLVHYEEFNLVGWCSHKLI